MSIGVMSSPRLSSESFDHWFYSSEKVLIIVQYVECEFLFSLMSFQILF